MRRRRRSVGENTFLRSRIEEKPCIATLCLAVQGPCDIRRDQQDTAYARLRDIFPACTHFDQLLRGVRGLQRTLRLDIACQNRQEMRSEEHTSELQSRPHLV